MWWWKAFATLNAALVVSTLVGPRADNYSGPFDAVGIAVCIPAAVGILLYAFHKDPYFNRDMPPRPFWMAFSRVFAFYSVAMLALTTKIWIGSGKMSLLAACGAFAVLAALQFFTWLPLRRYALRRHVLRLC